MVNPFGISLQPFKTNILLCTCLLIGVGQSHAQMAEGYDAALVKQWTNLNLDSKYHVGLSVYDIRKKKSIFDSRADNYFIPASNTKILTMYAALYFLGEQLDAAWYAVRGDSVILWGGGDPGTLYPNIDSSCTLIDYIHSSAKDIYFSNTHFQDTRYGKGWAWDDYPFTYQCERNAFPIYGNRLWIRRQGDQATITPAYLSSLVTLKQDSINKVNKSEWGDGYYYSYTVDRDSDEVEIPITYFRNDLQYCWSEATGKSIRFVQDPLPPDAIPVKGSVRDSLIKIMMKESDNFIAEQLLLACSQKAFRRMSDKEVIDSLLHGPLHDLKDNIQWVDGSGLSRYNLLTPRSIIDVLQRIIDEKGVAYLVNMLPAGGQPGMLQSWYKGKNGKPYVFAKTGTLGNTMCLSGVLVTASGKILLFSWMHNQYRENSGAIRAAMDKLFSFLYEHY